MGHRIIPKGSRLRRKLRRVPLNPHLLLLLLLQKHLPLLLGLDCNPNHLRYRKAQHHHRLQRLSHVLLQHLSVKLDIRHVLLIVINLSLDFVQGSSSTLQNIVGQSFQLAHEVLSLDVVDPLDETFSLSFDLLAERVYARGVVQSIFLAV